MTATLTAAGITTTATGTSSAAAALAPATVTDDTLLHHLRAGRLRRTSDPGEEAPAAGGMDPMIDLVMIILVAMNGERVEGLVMQMRNLMAGLYIDLLGDIIMGFLMWIIVVVMQICQVEVHKERG